MKKFIILIFALCLLFVSCAGDNEDTQGTAAENNNAETAENPGTPAEEITDPRFAVKEDIPELDFGGINFNILYPTWSMYVDYYFAEEEIGDNMNDAIYLRTRNVEDRFNITFDNIAPGYIYDIAPTVTRSVLAGSDDYHIALTHCLAGVVELSTGGYVLNWNRLPTVDFTKPWWNQRMNDTMSVEGALLTAVSDYIIFDPNVIYFNKRLMQDYELGDIYEIVRSGEWTWDKLLEFARLVSEDLDGDGTFTAADQYGFVTHVGWMMESALQAANIFIVNMGGGGYPAANLNTERFGRLMDTLYEVLFVGDQTFLGNWDANNLDDVYESQVPMSSDRALFHIDPLSAGKRYRSYDVEFGILPFPKLDTAQEEYLSLSWNGFMMIPNTADDQLVGAVAEALAAESHRLTVPAYYDVLLTSKVARDEESTEMIDIIYKGAVYDFGLNFANWETLSFSVSNILGTRRPPNWVSFVERYEPRFNTRIEDVWDKITENYS